MKKKKNFLLSQPSIFILFLIYPFYLNGTVLYFYSRRAIADADCKEERERHEKDGLAKENSRRKWKRRKYVPYFLHSNASIFL